MTTSTASAIKRLTAYVPVELYEWLKEHSKSENRTVSNYIETMIRSLKDQEQQ
jgi:hypothetical protein